jgi:stage IV sporulation protein FB
MQWSFPVARIAGVQVRIHLTFLIFLGWIGFRDGMEGGWVSALSGMTFILLIFACILLHEFGHALAARRYGIRTPDITLMPIGGLARLERIPEKPGQEIVVAIGGPLVSALLALGFGLLSGFAMPPLDDEIQSWSMLWSKLFVINAGLLCFNLLPVFPMDGGRVFRALLATTMSYQKSTRVAAVVGQGFAVLLGLGGIYLSAPMLVFVAVFVFLGAGSEAAQVDLKEASRGLRVRDAMLTTFTSLPRDARLADAVDLLLHASQHTFPLVDEGGSCVGLLTRNRLIEGLNLAGPMGFALEYARTDLSPVGPTQLLSHACRLMREQETPALPVLDGDERLVGVFTQENLSELLMMEGAGAARFGGWLRVFRGRR